MWHFTLTAPLAWYAAMDAANRAMRHAGRTSWSAEDYNLACLTFHTLWPIDRSAE